MVKATYYLDSAIRTNTTLTLKVTSNKKTPMQSGYVVGDKLYEWNFTATDTDRTAHIADLMYQDASYTEPFGKVYFNEGRIDLYFDAPPVLEGQDNIIIEYTSAENEPNYSPQLFRFELEHAGIYFFKGATGGGIGSEEKNFLCFSEMKNEVYIPATNYVNINYTGLIPLSDSTLGMFTKSGITYLVRSEEKIGSDLKYTYRNYAGPNGETAIAKDSIAVLNNDPLFLGENGVYALKLSENIKSNERYAMERSGFINSHLTKHEGLSNAKAIVWKNRYYLALDNKVYIADARYKTSARDSDMSDTFNYEWWVWENMPVNKWLILDDKLYFIDNDNRLCGFSESRSDDKIVDLSTFGASLGYFTSVETTANYYQFDLTKKELLKENNIIQLFSPNETRKFYIKNIDLSKGTFCLQAEGALEDDYIDNKEAIFDSYDSKGERFYVYMIDKTNVVSEWYTPIINMGTDLYSKNLLTSTLTFEPSIEGKVSYGYLTRRKSEPIFKDSSLTPNNGLDFENIDFTDFSFTTGFACSRTLKTKVRNFNYIQFRIISDTDKDCALNHFTITYNIGRKNKGVR